MSAQRELTFVRLRPDLPALAAWAMGLRSRAFAADAGYGVHAATKAVFGALAPQPFVLREDRERAAELLGYVAADLAALERVRDLPAEDAAAARALGLQTMELRAMPADWRIGEPLSFEVRVAPVVRSRSREPGKVVEVDAAFHASHAGASPGDRNTAYGRWLAAELARGGAAELLGWRELAFGLNAIARRAQAQAGAAARPTSHGLLPDLTVRGALAVREPAAFGALLARGLGRHRAFGFGCLLLAPPGRLHPAC